jgi:hypothetical protein
MKIELTQREIELIEAYERKEISIWANEEVQEVFGGVIDKAIELMHEENAYEEANGRLIAWYWNKYQAQETATTEG